MDPIVLSTHTYRQGCCESLRGWRRKLMLPLPPAIIYCNWYIRACTTQTGVPTDGLKKVILRLKPEQMNSDRNGKLGMCVKHGTEICLPWTRLLSSLSPPSSNTLLLSSTTSGHESHMADLQDLFPILNLPVCPTLLIINPHSQLKYSLLEL